MIKKILAKNFFTKTARTLFLGTLLISSVGFAPQAFAQSSECTTVFGGENGELPSYSCSTPTGVNYTCQQSGTGYSCNTTNASGATGPTFTTTNPTIVPSSFPPINSVVSPSALGYTPLEPIPVASGGSINYCDLTSYLNYLFPILITIGALFAVVNITVNGVRYMLSDKLTDKDHSKKRIYSSVWGLVLLVSSYLILNTINPALVNFNLSSLAAIPGSTAGQTCAAPSSTSS